MRLPAIDDFVRALDASAAAPRLVRALRAESWGSGGREVRDERA
jgi:hypothetical protein